MQLSVVKMSNSKCVTNYFKFNIIFLFIVCFAVVNYLKLQFVNHHLGFPINSSLNSPWNISNLKAIDVRARPKSIERGKIQRETPVYILWSRWRSGSSFLGKLLSYAKSKTFYSYEPLHALGLKVFKEESFEAKFGVKFLLDILSCRYKTHKYMLKYFIETEFYFFYNPMTKKKCNPVSICNQTTILSDLCQESKLKVVKLLRLSLKYGKYFLEKDPKIKIIYLARDPRGTLKSRSRLMWCLLSKDCHDPSTVCELLQEDLDYSLSLMTNYPQRFQFVRYEDLALKPEIVFKRIWENLGEKFTKRIERLISKHTSTNLEKGIYGLKKDSRKNAFSWRSSLDYMTLEKIQKSCITPMNNLGYYQFNSENDYENYNISALKPTWTSVLNNFDNRNIIQRYQ